MWHKDQITDGEIEALNQAAKRSWAADTKYPIAQVTGPDSGQCYVTSMWLQKRLGGHIGKKKGHYVWLSPEEDFVLDLASHTGSIIYEENTQGYRKYESTPNSRTQRFAGRANQIFDHLGKILHLSLDYMGDPLPASEPQRSTEIAQEKDQGGNDQTAQYWHDEPAWEPSNGEYKYVFANGQLEVSPGHDHEQLLAHTGVGKDYRGPMAMGHANLANNKATWTTDSNMNVKGLDKVFKDYSKKVGWDWGGLTNIEGEPISDDFGPKSSSVLYWIYGEDDHLRIGRDTPAGLAVRTGSFGESDISGTVTIEESRAYVSPVVGRTVYSLYEWAEDSGLRLYAENDNQLKVIPDMQQDNFYAEDPVEQHQYFPESPDERGPSGLYQCPACRRLFPGWDEYSDHRRRAHGGDEVGEINSGPSGFPEMEESTIQDSHFTPEQPNGFGDPIVAAVVMPSTRKEAARVDGYVASEDKIGDQYFVAYRYGSPVGYVRLREGKWIHSLAHSATISNALRAKVIKYTEKQPKDLLSAPIPFVYDIQKDNISLGEPGTRTSEIMGEFTPGGIVEGVYEPGGKVIFKTLTNMPYSVRHVVDLWYYQHPELSVTSVYLQDQSSGKKQKLAAEEEKGQDIGGYISSLVAADPVASKASKALEGDGGKVFAVGGAVRDALMGKEPKDIDLMVTGRTPAEVQASLEGLPGTVNLTGKDFGVFRYKEKGNEVEIALPRRERSTGEGHRDFDVQADPHMSPQEDLWRRDFTANAMAVNLGNGELIDPYGGRDDIQSGTLRTHNPESLSEDPLRVVRGLGANSRHGLVPDETTKAKMGEAAASLPALPQERVQQELDKLFGGEHPAQALRLAHETGALKYILPEIDATFGYDQNNPHHEHTLGDHMMNALEEVAKVSKDPDVRLATAMHDIGKPGAAWTDPETGKDHFYKKKQEDGSFIGENHEDLGADMTRAAMNRLRYPNDRIQRVTGLVQHHMFAGFTSEKGARKFLQRTGPLADDLLDLRLGDQGGKSEYPSQPVDSGQDSLNARKGLSLSIDNQRNLLDQVRNKRQVTNKSELAVNGNDLIAAGIRPGPQIGQILQNLEDAVVENPDLNTKEQLLNLVPNGAA
jgi:tRNA nucleotidyltransferase (CCA-adding enzyme)